MDASSPDDFADRLARVAADLLDLEGSPATTAKDAASDKATLVFALGPDGAHAKLAALIAAAEATLAPFGAKADTPRAAARFIADRRT